MASMPFVYDEEALAEARDLASKLLDQCLGQDEAVLREVIARTLYKVAHAAIHEAGASLREEELDS